jgi:hypothetical protein
MVIDKVILIQSPAKFYDAIPCFYAEAERIGFFDKYYFVTDYKGDYRVGNKAEIILLKRDSQFCNNMLFALSRIKEDIFFVCCEDHILKEGNDINNWNRCFDFVVNTKDVGFLRLTNTKNKVKPGGKVVDNIFPMARDYKYYISLQPGIWRRDYFEMSLTKDFDAWKYETAGTKKARKHKRLRSYSVKETVFFRTNFYKSGKYYRRQFIDYAIKHGMDIDKRRKVSIKGKEYSYDQYVAMVKNRE